MPGNIGARTFALLALCGPVLGTSGACTAASSVREALQVDNTKSGGMCICPSFPAPPADGSRCPPKSTTCGEAPGTLTNYYKRLNADPTFPGIEGCRNSSRLPPCYAWCSALCEADAACMMWDFHDKGAPACDLYNTTNVTRGDTNIGWVRRTAKPLPSSARCHTQVTVWPSSVACSDGWLSPQPETAMGCSTKGASADATTCCSGPVPPPSPVPPPAPPSPAPPAPAVNCDPNAKPPETCPSGKPCPQCGKTFCPCPPK